MMMMMTRCCKHGAVKQILILYALVYLRVEQVGLNSVYAQHHEDDLKYLRIEREQPLFKRQYQKRGDTSRYRR